MIRTVVLASIGGSACAALAAPIARAWERGTGAAPLILLNLVAPPSLLAIGVIGLIDRTPLRVWRDSDLPLMLGYVARFLPIAVLTVLFAWSRRSSHAMDAACAYNLPAWQAFRRITLPMRGPAILAAAALCALLIATELEVSVMLTPPGVTTLGVRFYSLIHTAPDAQVSALALGVVLLVALPIAVAAALLARRKGDRWN